MINFNRIKLEPLISYKNPLSEKYNIFKDNKNKSGIYRWTNKINNKSYIGSSVKLDRRFNLYYSTGFLINKLWKGKSAIYSALLKYNHSNFSLDIMEYCELNKLIEREQYYIDILKPEYNLCKIAGSSLGFKHTEKTRLQMSINNIGKNNLW